MNKLIRSIWLSAAFSISAHVAAAQAVTVFRGIPEVRILLEASGATVNAIASKDRGGYEAVVSLIGDRYYWASRENRELFRYETPGFVTFFAVDGSGFVRVQRPDAKPLNALMSATEQRHDYTEQLLTGLRTIVYYGATRAFVK
jgi:hypothetical protein